VSEELFKLLDEHFKQESCANCDKGNCAHKYTIWPQDYPNFPKKNMYITCTLVRRDQNNFGLKMAHEPSFMFNTQESTVEGNKYFNL